VGSSFRARKFPAAGFEKLKRDEDVEREI
jgi:hypothetical protein